MVDFYRHDIPSWMDGTEGLSHHEYRAYHVVCELIYLNEGPITFNQRGISGRCNMRLDHFRQAIESLVGAGKLRLMDGVLYNDRCARELDLIRQNRKNAAKGGRTSSRRSKVNHTERLDDPFERLDASSESLDASSKVLDASSKILDESCALIGGDKPLKNNGARQAPLSHVASLREESRGEESRKESSDFVGAPSAPEPEVFCPDPDPIPLDMADTCAAPTESEADEYDMPEWMKVTAPPSATWEPPPGLVSLKDIPEEEPRDPPEVEFWKRAEVLMAQGIARSRIGQMSNLLHGDWQRGYQIIADAAKARQPSPYLASIVRSLKAEQTGDPPPKQAKGEPEWVMRRRAEGAWIQKEGPNRWRDCGITLHDDEGREVGW